MKYKVLRFFNDLQDENYYYETVNKGKYFLFSFMIEPGDWDPSCEQVFDEIVKLSMLNREEER